MDDTRREGRKASFLSFDVVGAMVVVQIFQRVLDGNVSVWELLSIWNSGSSSSII